jgi:hypothetical protein
MTTRREFIRNVAIGTAAVSVGGVLPGFSAKSYQNIVGSNERIKMGAIVITGCSYLQVPIRASPHVIL